MKVEFQSYECETKWHVYRDADMLALRLNDAQDGMPVATASLLHPAAADWQAQAGVPLLCVKDFAENTGITEALVRSGIIEPEPYGIPLQSGFAKVQMYPLTDEALSDVKIQQPAFIERFTKRLKEETSELSEVLTEILDARTSDMDRLLGTSKSKQTALNDVRNLLDECGARVARMENLQCNGLSV